MDITGVLITVQVSGFMLDSDFREMLATRMSFEDGELG
jgi:hypothetical protein